MIDGVRRRMGDRAFFATTRGLIADHRLGIVSQREVVSAWLHGSRRPKAITRYLGNYLSPRAMRTLAGSRPAHRAGAAAGRTGGA